MTSGSVLGSGRPFKCLLGGEAREKCNHVNEICFSPKVHQQATYFLRGIVLLHTFRVTW